MLHTVPVQERRLDDYREDAGEAALERLREAAAPLAGARLLQVNSTAYGGGVAELLHSHVPLLADLGIEVTWGLFQGSEEFFAVTKAMHNALQGADVAWTVEMEDLYWERVCANAEAFSDGFDFVLVHDPQPLALLDVLEDEGRREGKWVWRCHIDVSAPFAPVWGFLEPAVNRYDAAIFTIPDFVRPGVRGPRVACIPPSIDPRSPKNAPLEPDAVRGLVAHYGVDPDRPLLVQVSRFDPWKDPFGVIDAFRAARERVPGLQLAMVGSLADDDPEGRHYLEATRDHAAGDADVHLLTNLDGVGDLEVNAFQRQATVVVQKSLREGFGLVVAEGMWKERPVVGGDVGGIRIQVEDGATGFLVDSVATCAERIVELLLDPGLAERMGKAGRERVRERFLTLRELEEQLRLLASIA
ncbi:MAG: glycosyltransferase [Actinomycetota bacterium]